MTKSHSAGALRYRLYFWLMDASLAFCLLAIAWAFVEVPYFPGPYGEELNFALILLTAFFITLVPVFLIAAKFMRDDYAEGIWRRSMQIVGVLAAVVPLATIVVSRVAHATYEPDGGVLHYASYYLYYAFERDLNARETMVMAWVVFLMGFVIIFQFLRWKDSR